MSKLNIQIFQCEKTQNYLSLPFINNRDLFIWSYWYILPLLLKIVKFTRFSNIGFVFLFISLYLNNDVQYSVIMSIWFGQLLVQINKSCSYGVFVWPLQNFLMQHLVVQEWWKCLYYPCPKISSAWCYSVQFGSIFKLHIYHFWIWFFIFATQFKVSKYEWNTSEEDFLSLSFPYLLSLVLLALFAAQFSRQLLPQ